MNNEPQIDTDKRRLKLNEITETIIGCAFEVANTLGSGFLERVYENALAHEIRAQGLDLQQQTPIQVRYDEIVVGEYFADLLVENRVIVELKAVKAFDEVHMAQCLNYLKASGLRVCLLINFGQPKIQIKRLVL